MEVPRFGGVVFWGGFSGFFDSTSEGSTTREKCATN
jgi:hypothetical protein